jgi:hypothetical protein
MNTNILKRFAQEARTKLMQQVAAKLDFVLTSDTSELREKQEQIKNLKKELEQSSKQEVIEKVAYTWFNRLMALRFMDANDYQPTGTRVISPIDGYTLPELLSEAKQGNIPEDLQIDRKKVMDLLDGRLESQNPQNEAFKLLLVASCNYLNNILPFLFERIEDYTELLLPDDLTSEFSIVQDVINGMNTEDCQQVEIIGWLYQFYISERKDEVFASKSKVSKEDIPAATQLFTPRWIVEYMVQNTLGKLWLQNHPESGLKEHMPYYIESASAQTDDYLKINSPEEIKLVDPACGSGHILVYAFDLLSKIYEEQGYNQSEIPALIIEKNLYGLEIDERAAQLSSMALMMKAREYNRRVFRRAIQPNINCYQDLHLSDEEIHESISLAINPSKELLHALKNMQQATNLGSLIIPHAPQSELQHAMEKVQLEVAKGDIFTRPNLQKLQAALQQLLLLGQKYHAVVANPPYMGAKKMNDDFKLWLKKNYLTSYQDLYSCFIVRAKDMLFKSGYGSFITLQGWMFVATFENCRKWILDHFTFFSLVQIGGNSFPSLNSQVARAVSFTIQNCPNDKNISSVSYDLDSVPNSHSVDKRKLFEENIKHQKYIGRNFNRFKEVNRYTFFHSITDELLDVFINSNLFENIAKPRVGLQTGSNDRFVRYWHEVSYRKSFWDNRKPSKWHPYNKGGDFRKWFGNNDNVVNWDNDGYEIKNFRDGNGKLRSRPQNESFYFKEGVTYSLIGNSDFCAREYGKGFIFDVGGSGFFPVFESKNFLLGLVNSRVGSYILSKLNPTVNFQVGDIGNIPIVYDVELKNEIDKLVETSVDISKNEWASYEENPDFKSNEILSVNAGKCLQEFLEFCLQKRIILSNKLFENETQLDNLFAQLYKIDFSQFNSLKKIGLYGSFRMSDKLSVDLDDNGWLSDIAYDFMSYAVGCMFGRYSLDKEGLILANQGETLEDYWQKLGANPQSLAPNTYVPDNDNIIPILEDEWFEDDIVGRFKEFLKVSFGAENFEKNLTFLEDCLGKDIRKYFVKDFYADHIKRYKKRPIYWMFSSPKGAFNVLIYMHRYTPDTVSNILNGYLREYQDKLKTSRENWVRLQVSGSAAEKNKAIKEVDKIDKTLLELNEYEREVLYPLATQSKSLSIDLDDGVLVNYNKFGKAIKSVAGLNDAKTKKKVKGFDWINVEEIRD